MLQPRVRGGLGSGAERERCAPTALVLSPPSSQSGCVCCAQTCRYPPAPGRSPAKADSAISAPRSHIPETPTNVKIR